MKTPMPHQENDLTKLAAQFINSTASHIFLTGKAGTGKTTFLKNLASKTHKKFVIVAPTGIAALNAEGVTIHSQFLLPLGSYIPENKPAGHFSENISLVTQHTLARRHPLNNIRKQVLRSIDLLIIDEVSMLRADILDAIDYRLRSAKRNFNIPFGGVQLLMIGDLFQLPPIIKPNEWSVLKNFYNSIHFFESRGLKQAGFTSIELSKIFRQKDESFIDVLNNLRDNNVSQTDIDILNSFYSKDPKPKVGSIILTTHNYQAEEINQKELNKLKKESHYFDAEIEDDFPENLFPVPERIELKVGAQIMFVKNDSVEGKYFNGKIATVKNINAEGVKVEMVDDKSTYTLRTEQWVNKKYSIHPETKEQEEDIVGSFTQFPIKLAWAITVHKSQGLTFDNAIIDVGRAFAPGQVYVALSRLRSLNGLTLRTPISNSVIASDGNIVSFSERIKNQPPLEQILKKDQVDYLSKMVASTFHFSELEELIQSVINEGKHLDFELENMRKALEILKVDFENERENAGIFVKQLQRLVYQNDHDLLLERIRKGSAYYLKFAEEKLKMLLEHLAYVMMFTRTKGYQTSLNDIDQLMMTKIHQIEKAEYITYSIINNHEIDKLDENINQRIQKRINLFDDAVQQARIELKDLKTKSGKSRKSKVKKEKGETYKITYAMVKEGMGMEEIAKTRELSLGTIESHAAKGILAGEIMVNEVLDKPTILELLEYKSELKANKLTPMFNKLKQRYSYGILRIMKAHIDSQ